MSRDSRSLLQTRLDKPRRRVTPVELFVGAGVLAAAWGLAGSWAALGVVPLVSWLAIHVLRRRNTSAMLPAYCLAVLPAATLGALYVIYATGGLKPGNIQGCERFERWEVILPVSMALTTGLIHALACFVLHARDAYRGQDSRWLACGILALGCLVSSGLLLWLDPGSVLAQLWWE